MLQDSHDIRIEIEVFEKGLHYIIIEGSYKSSKSVNQSPNGEDGALINSEDDMDDAAIDEELLLDDPQTEVSSNHKTSVFGYIFESWYICYLHT